MPGPRIAIATCQSLPGLDEDGSPLRAALDAEGIEGVPAVWSDEQIEWSGFDAVLLRSTWDYTLHLPAFLAWAERIAGVTTLLNELPVVRWNTDKRYLGELRDAGLPVVPTVFLEPGASFAPPAWDRFVVKPVVSAGALDTARYDHRGIAEAKRHAGALLAAGRAVMVQPYLDAVDEVGETALIHFAGSFSHAIRKGPILRDAVEYEHSLYAAENIERRDPRPVERETAARILAAAPVPCERLLYARVDLIPGPEGEPLLLELELTEPSLFLGYDDGAAARFARAVAERLR